MGHGAAISKGRWFWQGKPCWCSFLSWARALRPCHFTRGHCAEWGFGVHRAYAQEIFYIKWPFSAAAAGW